MSTAGVLPVECVSAIPGRVRLRVLHPRLSNGKFGELVSRVSELEAVTTVTPVPEARSLVLRYEARHRDLAELLRDVDTTAAAILEGSGLNGSHGRTAEVPPPPPVNPARVHVRHSFPGRLRLHIPHLRRQAHVAQHLEHSLGREDGIHQVEVSAHSDSVVVRYDPAMHHHAGVHSLVLKLLARAAEAPVEPPPFEKAKDLLATADEPRGLNPLVMPSTAVALAVTGLVPFPVTAAAVTVASIPLMRDAWQGVRERRFNVAQLDLTAVTVLLSLGDPLTGGIMTWLIGLGDFIRAKTTRKTRKAISELMSPARHTAWRQEEDGRIVSVPLEDLQPGDVVLVYAGDQVPVDGVVVEGRVLVDQKVLTGESVPVEKGPGDAVFALTIVADGQASVRVEHLGKETRAGRVVEMIENAPLCDTRIQNYAALVGDRLAGPIFGVAGVVYMLTLDPVRTAAVLILDFCSGIRVSAPTTILSAMTGAAKQGLFIKGGKAMEKLCQVNAVVFDKTGTVTLGAPAVGDVHSFVPDLTPEEVLRRAASAEANLKHPAAKAIVDAAHNWGLELSPATDMEYTLGMGVRTTVEGETVAVGSARFMRFLEIDAEFCADLAAEAHSLGRSTVYVASGSRLLGMLTYFDPPREEAAQVVQALRDRGVQRIVMLTGDNERAARAIAGLVGIDEVIAEAFPEEKAEVVQLLRDQGYTVAVAGDGINDSPAFTRADVGISFPHGADVARETADVILLDGDLRGLPRAIDLAREAMGVLRQNVNIIMGPNAVGLVAAAAGFSTPLISTMINNGTTIITAVNALRPLWAQPARMPAGQRALPAPAAAAQE